MQRAWNKYGEAAFSIEVLEVVDDLTQLIPKEQKHLDALQPAYNMSKTAVPASDLGRKHYIVTIPDGFEVQVHGLTDFCLKHGLSQAAMSQVAQGKVNQHKGFVCRYADETQESWLTKKVRSDKSGSGWKGNWVITFPDGTEQVVKSLTEFCKQHKLSQGNMTEVALGRRKQHKGFTCRQG